MYYLIYVPDDVERLGIAAESQFKLYATDKPKGMSMREFVQSELGLKENEFWVI